jgi:acetolactate synthase-1/3 small subunit
VLYEQRTKAEQIRRHTIAVLVDNEPGVLARVIGLFSGRGYNIDSLTVAEVDRAEHLSRITIVTSGTEQIIEQIKALLAKQVPVRQLADLTVEGEVIERELALAKVTGDRGRLIDALRVADFMGARLIDRTLDTLTFEVTGSSEDIDSFLRLLEPAEVSRAGVVAMARGTRTLSPQQL